MSVIPIIDLQAPHAPGEIRNACLATGFFYAVNHGVSRELIAAQFAIAVALFALPQEQKELLRSERSPAGNGYDPLRSQVLHTGMASDLKESFHCGPELPESHPYVAQGYPRYGCNQWPAELPGMKPQCLLYFDAMLDLGERLMRLVALSLDLPADYFAGFHDCPMADLRMLHYPPASAEQTGARQFGAGAHTDWGGVTILAQDDVGGLEVETIAGDWIAAVPAPDSFVINIGQLLTRWTNGLYRSNMHRVVTNRTGRSRYSIPFFYNPDFAARIECLPVCTSAENPPHWAPCSAGEHIEEMRRAALSSTKN